MKMKKNIILGTVVLMVLMAFAGSANAATITVGNSGEDYTTIQAALDAASDGDTIEVAAGTYTNDIWNSSLGTPAGYRITKSITLLGAQACVDPAGSTDRGGETILVRTNGLPYSLYAPNIIIDGFMFGSSNPDTGGRLIISDVADNAIIKNCIIQNAPDSWAGHGVYIDPGAGNALIDHNTFYNTAWEAIRCDGAAVISSNTIKDIPTNKGIYLGTSSNAQVFNNVITNTFYEGIQACGLAVITNNDISGCYKGIQIRDSAAGSTIDGNNIHDNTWEGIQALVSAIITDNDILGCYNGIQIRDSAAGTIIDGNNIHENQYWGLAIESGVTVATVTNNQFANNPYCGVTVWGDGDGSGIHINCNEITGNGIYGVESQRTTSDVDAENNWWGDASGPVHSTNPDGTGNTVSDNVDYSPWLGFTVGTTPMTWHTNDNIQDAIDAASDGDTIIVSAGTYYEVGQIVIDNNLAIIGADKVTTIIKPDHDTTVAGYVQSDAWIYVPPDVTFTLSDVTLDGTDLTGTPRIIRHAIQSRGELTVEDCIIKNIKATDVSYDGRGILLLAGTSNTIARCEFSDIHRIGIHVRGDVEPTNPIAYIEDCTYVGKGDGDWLDYGIEFGGGGSGTVDGCDISTCAGVADVDGSTSAGILATDYWGTGTVATVVNSIITGNTHGIAVGYADTDATILTAHCNDISGNIEYGILNVGTEEVDAENNWWGDVGGPYHLTSNPSGIGDTVSNNVDYDPWAGKVTGPTDPVEVNTPVDVTGHFACDMVNALFDWGDESTSSQDISLGDTSVTGSHTYTEAGVYTVTLTVDDDSGGEIMMEFQYVVVYDPSAGFITGGGWIDSPQGAYVADDTLSGKANFGFISKYKKGADTPDGTTQFQFKVADLKFHSENYDWLVIAGEHAKYKGTGTINDKGEYGFMLTATDGDFFGTPGSDTFRIKIWDKETETVVYDNKLGLDDTEYDGTELGGGNIVIHKAK